MSAEEEHEQMTELEALEHEESVDLSTLEVTALELRRENAGLAVRLAEAEAHTERMATEFAEAVTALDSLDRQVQQAREALKHCPHCGKELKLHYPKILYHPTKEPRLVKNEKEHKAAGPTWRERPYYSEPVMNEINTRRNVIILDEEARSVLDAPHKRGRFLAGRTTEAQEQRFLPPAANQVGQRWPCGYVSEPERVWEFCPRHGLSCRAGLR